MERKANKTDWQEGEMKRDDGGCDHVQFEVISSELFGVAVFLLHCQPQSLQHIAFANKKMCAKINVNTLMSWLQAIDICCI